MADDRMTEAPVPRHEHVPTADSFVHLRGNWDSFESVLAARGEQRSPRIAYLDGVVELMSPSRDHECITSTIGHLVVAYCLERGISISSIGAWTLQAKLKEAGLEPDDCFILGSNPRGKDRPDFAIEVIWTHGGIKKLEIYRRLGVGEVWYWEKGAIRVFVLVGDRYEDLARSVMLPDLDLDLLCRFVTIEVTTDAIRQFVAALRQSE